MTKTRTARRAEIERWLRVRDSEGLSLRGLSARSGIPAGTLSWWTHQLRHEHRHDVFVEVGLVDHDQDESVAEIAAAPACDLCIRHPSGVAFEFHGELARTVANQLVDAITRWS